MSKQVVKVSARALRYTGIVLLAAAGILAFLWFYWLLPWRHLHADLVWAHDSSNRSLWRETQKEIERIGLNHDSSIMIGRYGNKQWMEWTVKSLNPAWTNSYCGNAPWHLPDAPMYITNQRVENWSDWHAWWATNQSKSQEDWIRDGFQQRGVTLETPLTTNNIIALLRLIAGSRENHIVYNAQRWLRDSSISHQYVLEQGLDDLPADERNLVTKGALHYAFWLGAHRDDPSRLSMAIDAYDDSEMEQDMALIERPRWSWLPKFFLLTMAAGGVLLLRRSSRMVAIKHALP